MKRLIRRWSSRSAVVNLLIFTCAMVACTDHRKAMEQYQFEETRRLVAFVEDAASEFSLKGRAAFAEFGEKGSIWLKGDRYLFVYDLTGVCRFHPVSPELVGKNILGIKDLNGKPMIREIVQIASDSLHPHGWVHYLWMEPGEIYPEWKSSYIMRVRDPEGNIYAIGSGNYRQKMEKIFLSSMVDSAGRLLAEKGLDTIPVITDKAGKYYFYNSFIFILEMNGKALVDPSFPGLSGRNLLMMKDAIGKPVIQEMITQLRRVDSGWLSYMSKSADENKPVKKLAYFRKISINGRGYIVGSSILLEKPVWLKI